ncbi:divergent polysaccharide deacetylase family protein [Aurantimonas sp. MSK8Z-1]|uniref:divergent polysaccharide deacetylase family protein n=1 Tax=Mangrovibrevibacter kandeliae TaxID=2968473 RepID=UPI0021174E5E|nr:divergent polysaccharide deacetylase family protein [Aurantimonas sp. MSK8Z-1]MCW4116293.1 divergent polysaccharide deacetylase family protein [Aurantimonas sp. MSK8Z-1]
MSDDLFRPLGQAPRAVSRARVRLDPAALLPILAAAVIVAGSAATAWFQPQFRTASFEVPPPAPPKQPEPVARAPLPPPAKTGLDGVQAVGSPPPVVDTPYGRIDVRDPQSLRQPPAMAAFPDDALIESSRFGPLPVRASDGRRPFDVYAGASSGALGARIAVIVGGLGISQTGTQAAIQQLPGSVTLGFAASGNSLSRWMAEARRSGHELLLQAPMEPVGYPQVTPGENTVTVADMTAGAFDALYRSLGRMTNYVGVMNYMGARLTADADAMRAVMDEAARRGLMYLDDGSSSRSLAKATAMSEGTPFAASDILIDGDRDPAKIRQQLDALERTARAKGTAIGVASAFDTSVAEIAAWVHEAEGRGIEIVPVSTLAWDPEQH